MRECERIMNRESWKVFFVKFVKGFLCSPVRKYELRRVHRLARRKSHIWRKMPFFLCLTALVRFVQQGSAQRLLVRHCPWCTSRPAPWSCCLRRSGRVQVARFFSSADLSLELSCLNKNQLIESYDWNIPACKGRAESDSMGKVIKCLVSLEFVLVRRKYSWDLLDRRF